MGGGLGPGGPGPRETGAGLFGNEGPLITIMLSHGQELGLSPDQLQQLQRLRTTFDAEAERRSIDIRAAQRAFNALREQDHWDLSGLEAMVRQIATLQADLRVARLKTLAAGRALLTPTQLQQLKTIAQLMPPPGGPRGLGPGPASPPGGPSPPPPPRQ